MKKITDSLKPPYSSFSKIFSERKHNKSQIIAEMAKIIRVAPNRGSGTTEKQKKR
jgi:ABC-type phosphate transport system substrate-binding protein